MHYVLIRIDVGELEIEAGELRRVAGGEALFRTEHGADLEYALKPRGHGHLLIELRGLREIRLAVEIGQLKHVSAGFGGRAYYFGGVDLNEIALQQEIAEGSDELRLRLYHELVLFGAEVYPAVIEAGVDRGIGHEGHGARDGFDHELFDHHLTPAHLDGGVFHYLAVGGDDGLDRELIDLLRDFGESALIDGELELAEGVDYEISGGTAYLFNSGMTDRAGYCRIVYTEIDGMHYMTVLLGGESEAGLKSTSTQLARWGYRNYGTICVLSASRSLCSLPVTKVLEKSNVSVGITESVYAYLPSSVVPETDIVYEIKLSVSSLEAPVEIGKTVGTVTVSYKGEVLGVYDLVTLEVVPTNSLVSGVDTLSAYFQSRSFIATVVTMVILFAAYGCFAYIRYRRHKAIVRQFDRRHRRY